MVKKVELPKPLLPMSGWKANMLDWFGHHFSKTGIAQADEGSRIVESAIAELPHRTCRK